MLEHCVGAHYNDSSRPLSHNLHRYKALKVMIADLAFAGDGCSPSRPRSTSRRLINHGERSTVPIDGRFGGDQPTTTYECDLGRLESGSQGGEARRGRGRGRIEVHHS